MALSIIHNHRFSYGRDSKTNICGEDFKTRRDWIIMRVLRLILGNAIGSIPLEIAYCFPYHEIGIFSLVLR